MTRKSLDRHCHFRSITVGFRVSPEESALIDAQVALSGMAKQDYILSRLANRDIAVAPSSRMHKALREHMGRVYCELRRIRDGSEISPELEAVIGVLADEFTQLGEEQEASEVEKEDRLINGMGRL